MKTIITVFCLICAAIDVSAQKKSICIGPVKAIKSIQAKATENENGRELAQIIEALDTTLVNQINSSRKFDVVARKSALSAIMDEQDLGQSGIVDPGSAARIMEIAGAQYMVMTTVTDFNWGKQSKQFKRSNINVTSEAVVLNANVQIYDTTTGKLLESNKFRGSNRGPANQGGVFEGSTLTAITDHLAGEIVNGIVDVIYPAKVVAMFGSQVTLNRGEGTGVSVGQQWDVYALGEEIIDPDTGESLGADEIKIGQIEISRVNAKLSYAELIEDNGIEKGFILRKVPQITEVGNTNDVDSDKAKSDLDDEFDNF